VLGDTAAPLLKKINAEKQTEALQKQLIELGFSKNELDSLQKKQLMSDSTILQHAFLKRAEMFSVNLAGYAGNEEVVQVLFESSPIEMETQLVYFISIRSPKTQGSRAIFTRIYELSYCDYAEQGGLKFSFAKSAAPLKKILFNLNVIESCGLEVDGFERMDTLKFEGNQAVYTIGEKTSGASVNRMEHAK